MPPELGSLEELVAPLKESEFLELLRTRTLRFQPGSDGNRYGSLLDWQRLRQMIEAGNIPGEALRITKETVAIPPPLYVENGCVVRERVDRLMSHGASLIVERINHHVPALEKLCASIASRTAEAIKAGVIATTGDGGALDYHFDDEDLLIFQLEGSKRWRIHGPPVRYPVTGMNVSPTPRRELVFDDVLRPGDFLFLPAGYWHQCANERGLSLHLGFAFEPPTGCSAIRSLLPKLMGVELFRYPLTRHGETADKATLEAEVKARLIEQFKEMVSSMSLFGDAKARSPGG